MKDNEMNDLRGVDFSSLFSSIDKEVSLDEYIQTIKEKLQPILNKTFSNSPLKKEIHECHDRIEFACPYCGDSMKSDRKRRGNIILKKKFANFFKCHNCGEFKRVDQFFKEWDQELDLSVINYITNNINNFDSSFNKDFDLGVLVDTEKFEKFAITREFFKKVLNFQEAHDSEISYWLKKRLQFNSNFFLYDPYQKSLYILNLTQKGKIIGAQKRNFKNKQIGYRPKYITYNLSRLYEFIFDILKKKNKDTSKFDISRVSEKKIEEINIFSQLFNILNINISKPIILFEGPTDALMIKNSIGNSGLQKEFPLPIPLRYCFDDDDPGRKKTIQAIQQGKDVFLWEKFKRDHQLPYRKKWDMNDVFIYFHENNKKKPYIDNYFSDDPLDIIDI